MYGMFTYIWLICMINVGEYTIHGSYGIGMITISYISIFRFQPLVVCVCRSYQRLYDNVGTLVELQSLFAVL